MGEEAARKVCGSTNVPLAPPSSIERKSAFVSSCAAGVLGGGAAAGAATDGEIAHEIVHGSLRSTGFCCLEGGRGWGGERGGGWEKIERGD